MEIYGSDINHSGGEKRKKEKTYTKCVCDEHYDAVIPADTVSVAASVSELRWQSILLWTLGGNAVTVSCHVSDN